MRGNIGGLPVRPRTDVGWGPYNSTPSPTSTAAGGSSRLAPRRGGAFLGLLPEKETGRLGASLEWRAQAVACGRGAEAEAPSRAATPHSHQLQRTTREEVDLINGTLYHGTALRAARPCGVSFQAVLARLPDLASTHNKLTHLCITPYPTTLIIPHRDARRSAASRGIGGAVCDDVR